MWSCSAVHSSLVSLLPSLEFSSRHSPTQLATHPFSMECKALSSNVLPVQYSRITQLLFFSHALSYHLARHELHLVHAHCIKTCWCCVTYQSDALPLTTSRFSSSILAVFSIKTQTRWTLHPRMAKSSIQYPCDFQIQFYRTAHRLLFRFGLNSVQIQIQFVFRLYSVKRNLINMCDLTLQHYLTSFPDSTLATFSPNHQKRLVICLNSRKQNPWNICDLPVYLCFNTIHLPPYLDRNVRKSKN